MYRLTVTDSIRRDLERFEALRARFDADAFLARTWSGRLRRELQCEAIGASVSMEGVPVTVDDVRRILAGERPRGVRTSDAGLVLGYRDAMEMVQRRAADPSFRWDAGLIRGIHERVLAGASSNGAGRFREARVYIGERGTGELRYTPPVPGDVPGLVDDLAAWLESDAGGLPAPVAAAVAHLRIAGIHPFRDGNGRTARILASLVMYRAGYRLPQFTSLEEWWGGHLKDYYGAFACLGTAWNDSSDATRFVKAHVHAQAMQAEAFERRHLTERVLWLALEEIAAGSAAADRAANALWDAFWGRALSNVSYRGVVGVSAPTAASDLNRLAAAGLLRRSGAGRSTYYSGTVALFARVASVAGVTLDVQGVDAPDDALRSALFVALWQLLDTGHKSHPSRLID